MPQRIQLRRTKGWRLPEGALNVARPSMAGNPFVIGKHGDRAECVAKFRRIMTSSDHSEIIVLFEQLYPGPRVTGHLRTGNQSVPYQRSPGSEKADWFLCSTRSTILRCCKGKDLACWCPLDEQCHADVLLELANG